MRILEKIKLVLAIFGLLLSCAPKPTVSIDTNLKNIANYHTYAYLPNTDFDISSPNSGDNGMVTKQLIKTMNKNMQEKGYKVERDNPDLLIVLNAHYTNGEDTTGKVKIPVYANPAKPDGADPLSAYYNPYYYWEYANFNDILGYRIKKVKEKRAGLVIEVIARATKELAWKGLAKAPLTEAAETYEMTDYVDMILKEFPDSTTK